MHNVEQFQKEKDAVRARQRETQQQMKEDLMRQMEAHKLAKQEEKKHDLEYFEIIRKQKDDIAREEREKREQARAKVAEQKIIRDQQISEHNRIKKQESKDKKTDYERLRQMERELIE